MVGAAAHRQLPLEFGPAVSAGRSELRVVIHSRVERLVRKHGFCLADPADQLLRALVFEQVLYEPSAGDHVTLSLHERHVHRDRRQVPEPEEHRRDPENRVPAVQELHDPQDFQVRFQWELVRVQVQKVLPFRVLQTLQVPHAGQFCLQETEVPSFYAHRSRGEERVVEALENLPHVELDLRGRFGVHVDAEDVGGPPDGREQSLELTDVSVDADDEGQRETLMELLWGVH